MFGNMEVTRREQSTSTKRHEKSRIMIHSCKTRLAEYCYFASIS